MTTQPKALRLADCLNGNVMPSGWLNDAGAELRRQHAEIERLEAVNAELLEALKNMNRAYVNLLETGRDRIIGFGGTCDAVDVMEQSDPNLIECRAAISKAEAACPGA